MDKYDNDGKFTYTLHSVEKLLTEGIRIPVYITEQLSKTNNVEYIRLLLAHNQTKECLKVVLSLIHHQRDIGVTNRYSPVTLIDWLRKELVGDDVKKLDEALSVYRDECLMLQR